MKMLFALAVSALLLTASGSPAETTPAKTTPEGAAISAMGAYVPTDDMATSETFYRTLLNRQPAIALDDFVAFNIEGGWFAIVTRERYAPGSIAGSGSVPYMQSRDLEVLRDRITQLGLAAPDIIEEPGIRLLKIIDPNGQLIEFYKLTNQ